MGEGVFIASRFEEFAYHRSVLAEQLRATGRYTVYALDDGRAAAVTPLERSLALVKKASVVVVLIGDSYGETDASGRSITHHEWATAMDTEKRVLVYTTTFTPSDPRQAAFLKEVLKRGGDHERTVGELSSQARDLAQDVQRIVESIEETVAAVDDDGTGTSSSGILREMAHMGADGIAEFRLPSKLADSEPEYTRLIERRRFAFRELAAGENREAREYLEQAQQIYRRDWATNYAHARLLELRQRPGDLATALTLSRAAVLGLDDVEHAPRTISDPELLRRRRHAHTLACHARLLRKNDQPNEALSTAEEALQLEPYNRQALVERVLAATAAGDLPAARSDLIDLLKIYPDSAMSVLGWRQTATLRKELTKTSVEFVVERARAAGLDLSPPLQRGAGLVDAIGALRGGLEVTAAETRALVTALGELTDVGGDEQLTWRYLEPARGLAQAREAAAAVEDERAALSARADSLAQESAEPVASQATADAEVVSADTARAALKKESARAHRRLARAQRTRFVGRVVVAMLSVYVASFIAGTIGVLAPDLDSSLVSLGTAAVAIPGFVLLVRRSKRRLCARLAERARRIDAELEVATTRTERATAAAAGLHAARARTLDAARDLTRTEREVAESERRQAETAAAVEAARKALAMEARHAREVARRVAPELVPAQSRLGADAVVSLLVTRVVKNLAELNRAAGQFPRLALSHYVPVRRAAAGDVTRVRQADPVTAHGGLLTNDGRIVRVLDREEDLVVVSDIAAWQVPAGEALTVADLRRLERLERLMRVPLHATASDEERISA